MPENVPGGCPDACKGIGYCDLVSSLRKSCDLGEAANRRLRDSLREMQEDALTEKNRTDALTKLTQAAERVAVLLEPFATGEAAGLKYISPRARGWIQDFIEAYDEATKLC